MRDNGAKRTCGGRAWVNTHPRKEGQCARIGNRGYLLTRSKAHRYGAKVGLRPRVGNRELKGCLLPLLEHGGRHLEGELRRSRPLFEHDAPFPDRDGK